MTNKYTLKDRNKYYTQKCHAAKRGIAWHFTMDTWFEWWQQTGHWEERGHSLGQYVMARNGDVGPYDVNNIKCILCSENISDAQNKQKEKIARPRMSCLVCKKTNAINVFEQVHSKCLV